MRILVGPLNNRDHRAVAGAFEGFDVRCFDTHAADIAYRSSFQTFQDLWARLSQQWSPDVLIWWLPECARIPSGIHECPCLSVAIVENCELNPAETRSALEAFDHVFTDRGGVERLRQSGFDRVTHWPMNGFDPRQFRRLTNVERISDVTVVGAFNCDSQPDQPDWIRRVRSLARHFNFRFHSGVQGEEYARQLNQTKIVLNRSFRGEMNSPAYEAAACGALLFIEEENLEIRDCFVDRIHCVLYNQDNLEWLITYYLAHPEVREAIAHRGWLRVQAETFRQHFDRLLDLLERYARARQLHRPVVVPARPREPVRQLAALAS